MSNKVIGFIKDKTENAKEFAKKNKKKLIKGAALLGSIAIASGVSYVMKNRDYDGFDEDYSEESYDVVEEVEDEDDAEEAEESDEE